MVYRNNAGRLGAGFINVCLETRWLGQKRGFYVPGGPCTRFESIGHSSGTQPHAVAAPRSLLQGLHPGHVASSLVLVMVTLCWVLEFAERHQPVP